jgi:hypothetical protein
VAKKSPEPDPKPRPFPKKKPNKNDPPPAKLRGREEEEYEEDEEYIDPTTRKGGTGPEFDESGRRINQRRKRMMQNISTFLTVAVVLGIFGYAIYMLLWALKPPPPPPEMMAFVPLRTNYIYGMNVKEARYNEKFRAKIDGTVERAIPSHMAGIMSQLKLRFVDLERVIIACDSIIPAMSLQQPRLNLEFTEMNGVTAILKLRTTAWQSQDQQNRNEEVVDIQFSRADLQAATGAEEREHFGKRYYAGVSPGGTRYYYHGASSHVLVITESERNMKELLERSDQTIVIEGPIRDMATRYGGENFFYAMVSPRDALMNFEALGNPLLVGGKSLWGNGEAPQVGFAYAGGCYNQKVHVGNITYFTEPDTPKALKEASQAIIDELRGPLDKALSAPSDDELPLALRFMVEEIRNLKVFSDGNMYGFEMRYKTSVIEELLEKGTKFGNQSIQMPFPFYRGPFAGFAGQNQFGGGGGGGAPVGMGGLLPGPGGGVVIP